MLNKKKIIIMENNQARLTITITMTNQPIIINLQFLLITTKPQQQQVATLNLHLPPLKMPLAIMLKPLFSILKLEDLLV